MEYLVKLHRFVVYICQLSVLKVDGIYSREYV